VTNNANESKGHLVVTKKYVTFPTSNFLDLGHSIIPLETMDLNSKINSLKRTVESIQIAMENPLPTLPDEVFLRIFSYCFADIKVELRVPELIRKPKQVPQRDDDLAPLFRQPASPSVRCCCPYQNAEFFFTGNLRTRLDMRYKTAESQVRALTCHDPRCYRCGTSRSCRTSLSPS
jgi:hypothetical protein